MSNNSASRIIRAAVAAGIGFSAIIAPIATIPSASAYSNITSSESMIINHIQTEQGFKVGLTHSDFAKVEQGVQLHAIFDNGMYVLIDQPFVNAMDLASEYGTNYSVELVFAFHKESIGFTTYVKHATGRDEIKIDSSVGIIVQMPQTLYGSTGNTVIKQNGTRIEQLNDEGVIYGVFYTAGTYNVDGAGSVAQNTQQTVAIKSAPQVQTQQVANAQQQVQVKQETAKVAPVQNKAQETAPAKVEVQVKPQEKTQQVAPVKVAESVKAQTAPVSQVASVKAPVAQQNKATSIAKEAPSSFVGVQKEVQKSVAPSKVQVVVNSEIADLLEGLEDTNVVASNSEKEKDKSTGTGDLTIPPARDDEVDYKTAIPEARKEVQQTNFYREEETAIAIQKTNAGNSGFLVDSSNPEYTQNTKVEDIASMQKENKPATTPIKVATAGQIVGREVDVEKETSTSTPQEDMLVSGILPSANFQAKEGKQKGAVGLFAPSRTLTRGELGNMIASAIKLPVHGISSRSPYVDTYDTVYENDITGLYETAIMLGVTASKFAPEAPVTKQQAITVIARALEFRGVKLDRTLSNSEYSDIDSVNTYARGSVLALTTIGVLKPDSKGKFNPNTFIDKTMANTLLNDVLNTDPLLANYA